MLSNSKQLVLLILKSLSTWKDLFSIFDLVSSIVIILVFFGFVTNLTWLVLGWGFVKGFWTNSAKDKYLFLRILVSGFC